MKRIVVLSVVGLLLAHAVPAFAKGAYQVTLTGGGKQVTYTGEGNHETNSAISDLIDAVDLYNGMWIDYGARLDGPWIPRPEGDLGPRIEAMWLFIGPGGDIPIVQYLYPLAPDGPVAHIPGGQVFIDEVMRDTWFPIADDVDRALASVGFDLSGFDSSATPVAVRGFESPIAAVAHTVSTATALREKGVPIPGAGLGSAWMIAAALAAATGAAATLSGIMRRRNSRIV